MSYTKHNFASGDILLASDLNAMEDQIAQNEQTGSDLKSALNNGATQYLLSNYEWVLGRHITRGHNVSDPNSSTNTVALKITIPYDFNTYFVLSSGWIVAFASFDNNILVGGSQYYIQTPGKISMLDVYNSISTGSAHDFGDSLSINIRKSDTSAIDIQTFNPDDALKMYTMLSKSAPTKPTTWLAIGDSITDGRVSFANGVTKTNHYSQYGYVASKILGVDNYIEHGYGGMGYVHVANDGTYLTDVLDLDFGNPDIITVCLGVNDRSITLGDDNSTANDGTISGAIRNCCEVLGTKYKNSHIIFLTPLNSYATGDLSTGWCKRSGTTKLQDIANMVKYWCGLYGFPVVDMLNNSPINDFNIKSLILDDTHPTIDAHYAIGKYLAGSIPFAN